MPAIPSICAAVTKTFNYKKGANIKVYNVRCNFIITKHCFTVEANILVDFFVGPLLICMGQIQ